ncbi:hypothetical protein ACIRFH_19750 [Streptomyces sp. NPDC093586]|uniref:hypothetical protein n=1 Tax=Streptomyces sp. NPDC093586 TaxID=3366042 RepID=UPI003810F147
MYAQWLSPVEGAHPPPSVFVLSTPKPGSRVTTVPCDPETCRRWWEAGLRYQRTVHRIADEIRVAERRVRHTGTWIPFRRRRAMSALEHLRRRCLQEFQAAEAAYAPVRRRIADSLALEAWGRRRKILDEEIWGWTRAVGRDGTERVHVFRHDVPPSDFPRTATAGRPRLTLPELREALIELGRREARWDRAAITATDRALHDIGLATLWHQEFREDFFTGHSYATGPGPSTGGGNPSGGSSTGGTGGYIGGGTF